MFVLHSSLMLSPDLKMLPEGVAEVMLSLARAPDTRNISNTQSFSTRIVRDYNVIYCCIRRE